MLKIENYLRYDPDSGKLFWLVNKPPRAKAGQEAGCVCTTHGYRFVGLGGRNYRAHHLAWALMTGCFPNQEIDHINGIRDDNRWINLRLATHEQNAYNSKTRVDSSSGIRGVSWDTARNKWRAYVTYGKKTRALGRFNSIHEAQAARTEAALSGFGEFHPPT